MQKQRIQWLPVDEKGVMKVGLGIVYDHGMIGFHGAFSGYQTSAMYLPEKDAAFVVLVNMMSTAPGSSELVRDIAAALYPGALKAAGESGK